MWIKKLFIYLLFLILNFPPVVYAQSRAEAGRTFIENYLPKEYAALTQIWTTILSLQVPEKIIIPVLQVAV
jgi:hypothetical protein